MIQTNLTIQFNESLSDSSIKLIQTILKDSLNYDTTILEHKEMI